MPEIDISEVLRRKMPRGSRLVPRFVVRAIERLVHADEINAALDEFGDLAPCDFIREAFARLNISYRAEGLDAVDLSSRPLFVSNHPFGGMDGMMLAELICGRFGDVRVVVNDLLDHIRPLRPLWLPVNKHGRQNPEYAQRMHEAMAGDLPVLTFPAGLCSRRRDGVVADPVWRKSFIKHAAAYGRQIVPVYVEGALSDRFYRLSRLREMVGMKFNAEMILLPDEMFRQAGSSFTIRFGRPVAESDFAGCATAADKALAVRGLCYALAGGGK